MTGGTAACSGEVEAGRAGAPEAAATADRQDGVGR